MKLAILFLCTNNSCRSQMAEGIVNHYYGEVLNAYSAGTRPTSIHPSAIKAMAEIGIDISKQRSKSVENFTDRKFDYVITLCGDDTKDVCPIFTGKTRERLYWSFIDPEESKGNEEDVFKTFKKVRDEINTKIGEFAKEVKERGKHERIV